MFFGSQLMEFLTPKNFFEVGYCKTSELPLSQADPNSPTAVLPAGKIVDMKDNDDTVLKLGTGFGIGILTRDVNFSGTTDDAGFKKLTVGGFPDIPVKKGLAVTVQCPLPGAEAIFEGQGTVTTDDIAHLVIKTGVGAISGATAINSLLSVVNGAWRIAQTGDFVLAILRQANYTPKVAGGIRIRVRFISPYKI